MLLIALLVTPVMAAPSGNTQAIATTIGAISGEVFVDGNINRIREPLETGIANVRIVLRNANHELITETTTDSDGYYVFDNLETATYQIQIVPPPGFIITDNGSVSITIGEVGAPLMISTSLRYGVFVPLVSR